MGDNNSPLNFHLPRLSWMWILVCVTASVNGTFWFKEKENLVGEARIILPQEDNLGNSLVQVQGELESKIVDSFGGFSNFEGLGGWKSEDSGFLHHEKVWYYDIAAPVDQNSFETLLELASWLREAANQESVYLRLPNGRVQFV